MWLVLVGSAGQVVDPLRDEALAVGLVAISDAVSVEEAVDGDSEIDFEIDDQVLIIAAIARPDRAANEVDVVKEFSALSERCDVHRDCERHHHKAPGEGPDVDGVDQAWIPPGA